MSGLFDSLWVDLLSRKYVPDVYTPMMLERVVKELVKLYAPEPVPQYVSDGSLLRDPQRGLSLSEGFFAVLKEKTAVSKEVDGWKFSGGGKAHWTAVRGDVIIGIRDGVISVWSVSGAAAPVAIPQSVTLEIAKRQARDRQNNG